MTGKYADVYFNIFKSNIFSSQMCSINAINCVSPLKPSFFYSLDEFK